MLSSQWRRQSAALIRPWRLEKRRKCKTSKARELSRVFKSGKTGSFTGSHRRGGIATNVYYAEHKYTRCDDDRQKEKCHRVPGSSAVPASAGRAWPTCLPASPALHTFTEPALISQWSHGVKTGRDHHKLQTWGVRRHCYNGGSSEALMPACTLTTNKYSAARKEKAESHLFT